MTGRERILALFEGRRPDRVPVHHLQFSGHAARVILGREACVGGAHVQWLELQALWQGADEHRAFEAQCEADAVAIAEACGHDMLRLRYWRWPREIAPVARLGDDAFRVRHPGGAEQVVRYDRGLELLLWEGGVATSQLTGAAVSGEPSEDDLHRRVAAAEAVAAAYAPPRGPDPAMAAMVRKYPRYLVRLGLPSPQVDMASEKELAEIALWPGLFGRLLLAQGRRQAADLAAMAAAGAAVNFTGCDFCSAQGPCVSPAMFRQAILPALQAYVAEGHRHGLRAVYGCDGNIWPLAGMLFDEIGLDGWIEVDKSAGMDLRELRRRYPRQVFFGNIPVQVLHHGTADDVRREALECLEAAHEAGGIVVGCSNMIMPGTPPANIEALLAALAQVR